MVFVGHTKAARRLKIKSLEIQIKAQPVEIGFTLITNEP